MCQYHVSYMALGEWVATHLHARQSFRLISAVWSFFPELGPAAVLDDVAACDTS